jgi:hypothetical protein
MHETKGHFCQKVFEDLLDVVRFTVLVRIFMLACDIKPTFFHATTKSLANRIPPAKTFSSPRFFSIIGQYSSVLPLIGCLERWEKIS